MPVKLLNRARRFTHRLTRTPFPPGTRDQPLLVHCSHHKVGTVWFRRVLSGVAAHYGLRMYRGLQDGLGRQDIFFQNNSRIDRDRLPAFRGSHMVRDPRDMIISGYFYHLRTTEEWALVPQEIYDGRSYQEHLRSLDQDAGIHAEIEHCSRTFIRDMLKWPYDDPRFIELRYEDLLADEEAGFTALFTHYGFAPDAVVTCTEIALGFSLNKVKAKTSHIRSGQPGEWETLFTDAHRQAFKELTGDAAVKLGYAADSNW